MLKNLKILLVEDDFDLRSIFSSQLKNLNSTLYVAQSGNEAIKLLETGLSLDCIISDYSMPNGDGAALLRYVASTGCSLPFIFFTNDIDPEIPVKYEKFLGTVHKLQFDELVNVIKTI
ncbi:MAG: response regulator [Bacteriovoracaceae bacterium]|jgi:CheY-like chemotaxis protein|nr:response regulator [Bacteriovoracaceae bacterium]|tara:strand:+ start:1084 stop:1437 length:354 start_codon:yes stop_codon:yes gene_type:complete